MDTAFCWSILPRVSRTFAIGIRVLPRRDRNAVMVSYLLCRIADTIEDDPCMPADDKLRVLSLFDQALEGAISVETFVDDVGDLAGEVAHVTLVREARAVFVVWRALSARQVIITRRWIREMVVGMQDFVRSYPQGIRLRTKQEFSRYCYYVAGTVGHLLTELWTEGSTAGAKVKPSLKRLAENFGRGLQAVNILRDVVADAKIGNSIFLPDELLKAQGTSHAQMLDARSADATEAVVKTMARAADADLQDALAFTQMIPRHWVQVRFFCAFPLTLAIASLRVLESSTFDPASLKGPKINRRDVRRLFWLTACAVLSNRALAGLVGGVAGRPWQGSRPWLASVFAYLYGGQAAPLPASVARIQR